MRLLAKCGFRVDLFHELILVIIVIVIVIVFILIISISFPLSQYNPNIP